MTQKNTNGFYFKHVLLDTGWKQKVSARLNQHGLFHHISSDNNPDNLPVIEGHVVPGVSNLHSHSFQRAMAGLAEKQGRVNDSFWGWRDIMYRFVNQLNPDDVRSIASKLYVDFLKGGFTSVGEFHYLHHAPDGRAYADPAEMSMAIIDSAKTAQIALTHLPVFYAHAGFGGLATSEQQRRFIHDIDAYQRLIQTLSKRVEQTSGLLQLGVAPHSLRAVTRDELHDLRTLQNELIPGSPLHIHIAEQQKEVQDCLDYTGARPVQWLYDQLDVDDSWCLIHASQVDSDEIALMARSQSIVGLCPTTEANLGDGIFPAEQFLKLGGQFGIGTDSNVCTRLGEEIQLLEYSQRLALKRRNIMASDLQPHVGEFLLSHAALSGAKALGQNAGAIRKGLRADFLVLDPDRETPWLSNGTYLDYWLFGANNRAPRDVYVGGTKVIDQGRHPDQQAINQAYINTMNKLYTLL
jgi:formimidoylglutamate deiminase